MIIVETLGKILFFLLFVRLRKKGWLDVNVTIGEEVIYLEATLVANSIEDDA